MGYLLVINDVRTIIEQTENIFIADLNVYNIFLLSLAPHTGQEP